MNNNQKSMVWFVHAAYCACTCAAIGFVIGSTVMSVSSSGSYRHDDSFFSGGLLGICMGGMIGGIIPGIFSAWFLLLSMITQVSKAVRANEDDVS
jgi:hypothetical protein